MAVVKKIEHKMHLTDYLWILKKRALLIVFFWATIFTIVAVATFMEDPRYRASAQLLIERSVDQPQVLQGMTAGPGEEFYNSQYQLLRSRRIARKLYNDMHMYDWESFKSAPADVDPISVVQSWIRVTPIPKTHLVEVWMIWPDNRQAADMVNRVTDAYKDIVEEFRTTTVERSVRVLMERAGDIERKLGETSRAIQVFSAERGIFAMPEIRSVVLTRERWLQDATAQANVELITTQSTYDALMKSIESGEFQETRDSDILQTLREKKYAIDEVDRMNSITRTPQYRKGDELDRTLQARREEVDRQLALEKTRVQRSAVAEASQRLATAQANYDVLNQMLKANRESLTQISQDLQKLEGLQKQQVGLEEIRSTLTRAAENVKTAFQYEDTRVQVINKADIPKAKYSPNPEMNLPLGAAVGLLVGIGAAFFLEYLNTTIRMPRDIEDGLGLPVLGFVPAMSSKLKDFASRALISHLDSRSGPAEAFRGIRTEVMLRSDLRQVKTGMVTSTSPQEGKTTVAINWAIALAQAGNKVLLIDADLRKPMVHMAFNMKADRGLSTLLSEKDAATVYIKKTDIENLHVLPGGPVPQNPAELLGSRKMRTLIAEAAERYDSVIIDASPVLGVADANILSTMVDCVVLVVQASKNRRGLVMRAKNQLASVNARLAGAVLNNVRGTRGDYYYYRQYYRPVVEMMEQQEKV
jgi:capsular exopolysaccharide synthesis family protein